MHLAKFSPLPTIFLSALVLTGMTACSGTHGSVPTEAVVHGRAVYQLNCQACHEETNLQLIKQPPRLVGLFQNSKLPSGAPANEEEVRKTILEGRGIMPPFKNALDKEDLDDLVAYLHTL